MTTPLVVLIGFACFAAGMVIGFLCCLECKR